MLAASFANALNPELAKYKEGKDYQAIINLWMDVIRKLAFVFAPAFALLLVLRREFITLLFTAELRGLSPDLRYQPVRHVARDCRPPAHPAPF